MKVLDLFSGIGGFSLGLERAGMTTVAFCEQNKFCHTILKKHWPDVPIYDDVQTLSAARLANDGITVDVICGGFPCQDISIAGKGAGLAGERSGLWWHFHRLIEEIRPSWVVIENVSALRRNGLGDVLRSLAAVGYDAEWHCIPASAVGAPHRRDRIWIVAYPAQLHRDGGDHYSRVSVEQQKVSESRNDGRQEDVAYSDGSVASDGGQRPVAAGESLGRRDDGRGSDTDAGQVALRLPRETEGTVADASSPRLSWRKWLRNHDGKVETGQAPASRSTAECGTSGREQAHSWNTEPDVGRVADGVPSRVDRLKALGNAVVPQIPELIGRAILEQSCNDIERHQLRQPSGHEALG
jgi:DNA (cytosine-5)-methyltransferase 1